MRGIRHGTRAEKQFSDEMKRYKHSKPNKKVPGLSSNDPIALGRKEKTGRPAHNSQQTCLHSRRPFAIGSPACRRRFTGWIDCFDFRDELECWECLCVILLYLT
jgi:hypothetical protein